MSIRVMSQVWDDSAQKGGDLLVLLALADFADDQARAWPSNATLAKKARMSERNVRYVLRRLETEGEIETIRAGGVHDGRNRATVYRLTVGAGKICPPANGDTEGGQTDAAQVSQIAPYPSVEPSVEPSGNDCAPAKLTVIEGGEPTFQAKVDREPVTRAEHDFAVAVLAEFNDQTGGRFASKTTLAKIVMRRREHPEVDVADHAEVIRRNLAAPWWSGKATPSVIYGSDEQFERAMACEVSQQPRAGSRRDAERASQAGTFEFFDRLQSGEFGDGIG